MIKRTMSGRAHLQTAWPAARPQAAVVLRAEHPPHAAASLSVPSTRSPVTEGEGSSPHSEGREVQDVSPHPAITLLLGFPPDHLPFPSPPRGLSSLAWRTGATKAAPVPPSATQPQRAEPKLAKGSAPSSPLHPLLGVTVPHPHRSTADLHEPPFNFYMPGSSLANTLRRQCLGSCNTDFFFLK